MPELPEVETVRRGLEKLIVGRTVKAVSSDTARSFPNAENDVAAFLVGATITNITRRAKVLIIDLSSEYSLVVHLKMTGQLVFVGDTRFGAGHPTDSLVNGLPDKSTRVTLTFDDGSKLFFNDQRKFGWMRLLPAVEVSNIDFMRTVGPEPLEDSFTSEEFVTRLTKRAKSTIKAVLLDQKVVAGVGNIYADESLWAAKIHPAARVQDVPVGKLNTLFTELRAILVAAIDAGGSTDRNYVDAEGKRGSYLTFAKVFHKQGQPCPRCGTMIEKTKVAGRGTHICPNCQKVQ